MAPKRKAPAANGRAAKRVASGVNTPVSMGSSDIDDDDYSNYGDGDGDDDGDGEEADFEPQQDLTSQWLSPV